MVKTFRIDKSQAGLLSKATMFKVLKYLDARTRGGKISKLETPVLLMDKDKIREKALTAGRHIKNSKVFYAVKANPDVQVLRLIKGLGLGFEIASDGELAVLMELKVNPRRIITSHPIKSPKFIKMAYGYGVRHFAYDSKDEVDKLSDIAPDSKVYVRLTVPNEGSEWPLSKKFGVEIGDALALMLYARDKGVHTYGITFHVGSQCLNLNNWSHAIIKTRELWEKAKDEGISLSMVNIGGGYPIRYTKGVLGIEQIERHIDRLIAQHLPKGVRVFIEPGRAIVGDSGVFVCRVAGKAKRGPETWIYIDAGVFNGLMESVGGIRYSYITEAVSRQQRRARFVVAGPSCDSFDVIEKEAEMDEPETGCIVLIPSAGAYTISYASEFNGFAIPKTRLI